MPTPDDQKQIYTQSIPRKSSSSSATPRLSSSSGFRDAFEFESPIRTLIGSDKKMYEQQYYEELPGYQDSSLNINRLRWSLTSLLLLSA